MKCLRHDPVCKGGEATEIVVWIPTGKETKVCVACSEAIIKRSNRIANIFHRKPNWRVK